MEAEVLGNYKSIKVVPSGVKLIGEMDTYNNTIGFHMTAFDATMLAAGESSTLITDAERVKVVKNAGEVWTAGDPIYWIEASDEFSNVAGTGSQLIGKATQGALTAAVIGFVWFTDQSPIQRGLSLGTSGTPLIIVAADPMLELYVTSATVGNIESMIVDTVLTGVGSTGGRARFQLNTEAVLGGWCNALKALVDFGATGAVSGLASAFCAEMVMPTTAPGGGNYVSLEAEMVFPAGAGVGSRTGYIYCNVQGADKATFQGAGYFAIIDNAGDASDGLFYSTNNGTTDAWLRVSINSVDYYIMMSLVATEA